MDLFGWILQKGSTYYISECNSKQINNEQSIIY